CPTRPSRPSVANSPAVSARPPAEIANHLTPGPSGELGLRPLGSRAVVGRAAGGLWSLRRGVIAHFADSPRRSDHKRVGEQGCGWQDCGDPDASCEGTGPPFG